MNDFCPWSIKPLTVFQLIGTTTQMTEWERDHIRSAPDEWKPIVTSELMTDICNKIVSLELQLAHLRAIPQGVMRIPVTDTYNDIGE